LRDGKTGVGEKEKKEQQQRRRRIPRVAAVATVTPRHLQLRPLVCSSSLSRSLSLSLYFFLTQTGGPLWPQSREEDENSN
jgi:hypothetical protein